MADHRQTSKHSAKSAADDKIGKTPHVFEQSRDSAREAARRAAGEIEANPLAVVVGGAALGALIAGLVPRSQREKELLAPVGKRIATSAAAAVAAARESGTAELEARGLTVDGAKEQFRSLLDGLGKAASSAGAAAASAARNQASPGGEPA